MTNAVRLRALAGAVALAAAMGAVAACGDDGGSTTVASREGSAKADRGSATVETSRGSATVGQGLPEGFPADDVPLLDEEVLNGIKGTDGGPFAWSVVMSSDRAIDDLSAELTNQFAAAGYRTTQSTALGEVNIHRFSDHAHDVSVTIARTGDGTTITYLVKDSD